MKTNNPSEKTMYRFDRHIVSRVSALVAFVWLAAASAFGQEATTNQTLTLQVFETNRIDVTQRALNLVINQASLETGTIVEAVNQDGNLVWLTNGDNKKITVASNNASPRFLVKMDALDITGSTGTAAPEVTLSDNTIKDLILGVTRSWGKCKIRFIASAKVADGIGTESYEITYTITGS
jgi:hypothetical protein